MKRCPSCQRGYADESLRFCLEDGAPLIEDTTTPPLDSAPTLVAPPTSFDIPQTPGNYRPNPAPDARTQPVGWRAPQTGSAHGAPTVPSFTGIQPPPPGRSYLGWVIGGVVLLFLLGALAVGAYVAWSMIKPSGSTGDVSTPARQTVKEVVVSKLGGGQYTSINAAIKGAPEGARINVRPGIYNESVVINRNVEIIGDGPITQIVVDAVDDNCISMEAGTALVRGLTLRNRSTGKDKFYAVSITQGKLTLEDCDITSVALTGVGVYGASSQLIMSRCRIHDCAEGGIFFYENAGGIVEDCDVFNNGYAGISIKGGADPVIRKSRIYNGKSSGIYSYLNGKGTIEDCNIYGNAYSGVSMSEGGDPFVNRCKINRNGYNGVYSYKGGKGTVQNSDLTGNKQGPWDIDKSSTVRRSGNTE